MSSSKPAGRYGVDALWVPLLWTGLGLLYVVLAVLGATTWGNPAWATVILAVLAVGFFAGAGLYWHATLRGKFVVWDELLADAGSPDRALDLGCGHGAVAIMVARRVRDVTVDGIDLWRSIDQSGNSPDAAIANARANGVADRVHFRTGDMTDLSFPDATFDLVTASLAIHNIHSADGRATAIDEAWRVLNPGGRLLILDISKTGEYQRRLIELGAEVSVRRAGWRVWWSGPWMASRMIIAAKASETGQ